MTGIAYLGNTIGLGRARRGISSGIHHLGTSGPRLIFTPSAPITELSPNGTVVGTASGNGGPENITFSDWTLTDDYNGAFAIDPVTGVVTVADPAELLCPVGWLSPIPFETFTGTTQRFAWVPGGYTEFQIVVTPNSGGIPIHVSEVLMSNIYEIPGLPADGSQVVVDLRYRVDGGAWRELTAIFVSHTTVAEANQSPTSPAIGPLPLKHDETIEVDAAGQSADPENETLFVAKIGAATADLGQWIDITNGEARLLPSGSIEIRSNPGYYGALIIPYAVSDGVNTSSDANISASVSSNVLTTPALYLPGPSTTLFRQNPSFRWTTAGNVEYQLLLGSTLGGSDYFDSGVLINPFVTPTGLPGAGETVYARLLFRAAGGTWYWIDTTFTARTVSAAPVAVPGSEGPYAVTKNILLNMPLLANDTGANLSIVAINQFTAQVDVPIVINNGSCTLRSDGTVDYLPNTDFIGEDSFSYYVSANGSEPVYSDVYLNVAEVGAPTPPPPPAPAPAATPPPQVRPPLTPETISFDPALARYVDPNGSDAANGQSVSNPWRTLAYAAQQAVPGTTIFVKSGTYTTGTIVFASNGTSAAPIRVVGYRASPGDANAYRSGETFVTINAANGPVLRGATRNSGLIFSLDNRSYIELHNLQMTNVSACVYGTAMSYCRIVNCFGRDLGDLNADYNGLGIKFHRNSHHNEALNCVVINAGAEGIMNLGDDSKTVGCFVASNDNQTGGKSSTDYFCWTTGLRNYIAHNTVLRVEPHDHVGHGVIVEANLDPGYSAENNLVYSNTAIGFEGGAFQLRWSGVKNNRLLDNVARDGGGTALMIRDGAEGNSVENHTGTNMAIGIGFFGVGEDGTFFTHYRSGTSNTILDMSLTNMTTAAISFHSYIHSTANANDNIIERLALNGATRLFEKNHHSAGNIMRDSTITGVPVLINGTFAGEGTGFTFENTTGVPA